MKCIVVDDEPLARQLIEGYIQRVDGLMLVKSCANAVEAFEAVHIMPVDLIFLDIEMPKVTGLDFLRSLSKPPKVILTTAYREFAFEAYNLDVIDYLLKPILFERFLRSLSKVYEFGPSLRALHPPATVNPSSKHPYIYFKEDREMVKVYIKDILYIESMKDYVKVKTTDKQIISYQRISYLEEKLPADKFLRIHRSFIIALDRVNAYTVHSVKVGTMEIPIGRNYKLEALKVLNENNIFN